MYISLPTLQGVSHILGSALGLVDLHDLLHESVGGDAHASSEVEAQPS